MPERILKDSVTIGLLIGMLSIALDYVLFLNLDKLYNHLTGNDYILNAPRLQLLILAVNIILFRFIVVKWKKIETGKGVLLAIIGVSLWYLWFHKFKL